MAEGYMGKTAAMEHIRERTGYGRAIVERKMEEMARDGAIKILTDPGRRGMYIIALVDIEKVVMALTPPPPPTS